MTEPSFNQFAAPAAEVADVPQGGGFAELNYFSADGRIGRLRYMAYVCGGGMILNIAGRVLEALIPNQPVAIGIVMLLPVIWFSVICGIKRAHDFDSSGWSSIASLVPLLGTLLWALIPGGQGANRYGPPPPPNTWGVRVLGLILPIFFGVAMIGIIAAIAIPQYAAYTHRAQAAQQQTQAANPR